MTYFDGLFFVPALDSREGETPENDGDCEVYSLHFCRAGRVLWSQGFDEPRALPAPVVWWTVPNGCYRFGPAPMGEGSGNSDTWEHWAIAFSGPRAVLMREHGLIQGDFLKPHFLLLQDASGVEGTFLSLLSLLKREDAVARGSDDPQRRTAPARAVLLLEELLLSLGEHQVSTLDLSPLEQAVYDWLEKVKIAPEKEWSIAEGAAGLSISQGHFRRLARRIVGVSPYRFALQRRLDAAAWRLRSSKEPIKSLAPACGFKDVNYFSRLFTQRFHLTPAAYRRANRMVSLEATRMRRRHTLIESLTNRPLPKRLSS